MATNKTTFTQDDVIAFIEKVENEQKRKDSYRLISLMEVITGEKARMYGPSIIGFGEYAYTYESGHSGKAPLVGFSPRKAAISLYVFTENEDEMHLLEGLGKFTMGKACIYVKKLSDINESVLNTLMQASIDFVSTKFERIK